MSGTPMFERSLAEWLDDQARTAPPDHVLAAALERTSHTRQVSSRSIRLRWPLVPARTPTGSVLRFALLLALLAGALLGAIVLGGALMRDRDRLGADGGHIAYDRDGDVWLATPDGEVRRITATPDIESVPALSPDGSRLAWLAADGHHAALVVANADGSDPVTFEPPGDVFVPSVGPIHGWSADGGRIALFARGSPGEPHAGLEQVLVLDVDAGSWTMPTVESGQVITFGWSPVGSLLGIKELRGWDLALGVLEPGTTDARWLLDRGAVYDGATFRSDGRAILLHRQSSGRAFDGDIVSVDILDGEVTTLVGGPTNDVAPATSPDGSLLVFARSDAATVTAAVDPLSSDPPAAGLYALPLVDGRPPHGATARLLVEGVWPGVVWAPDGGRLLVRTRDRGSTLLVSSQGGEGPVPGPDIPWPDHQAPTWATGPP